MKVTRRKWTLADAYSTSPTTVLKVDILAEDYAVGFLANGAAITNKFNNNSLPFTVVTTNPSGLEVVVNSDGRKEFVFDGLTVLECADKNTFQPFHINNSWSIMVTGKIGIASNPDAYYGICGNSGSSTNIGMCLGWENRISQPTRQGFQHLVARGVASLWAYESIIRSTHWNTRKSFVLDHRNVDLDQDRLFVNSDLQGVHDRTRNGAHTTSGLATPYAVNTGNPTYNFQIGSIGNGAVKLVGRIERFTLILTTSSVDFIGQADSAIGVPALKGLSNRITIKYTQVINNGGYVLGGMYSKRDDKTKTSFISSTGPNHFTAGSDREGIRTISDDDGYNWPSYTSQWTSPTEAIHGGVSGGYTSTGRLVAVYGKYNSTTGAYIGIYSRYSDDDGVTWSSEFTFTIPTTSPQINAWAAHDKLIVCENGDIAITWYSAVVPGPTQPFKIYFARSSDNGVSFSSVEVFTSTTRYVNESSAVKYGTSKIAVVSRVEAIDSGTFKHEIFKSTNDGATFTSIGTTNYGISMAVYAHPPMVRSFLLDGTLCLGWYVRDRSRRRWYVVYTTAANFDTNGLTAFTGAPTYELDIPNPKSSYISGYAFVIHPDNDIKFEGVIFDEISSSQTNTYFFKVGDDHKAAVKTALGL